MPFANLSGDPEQDYFADGMVVEIVEALSRIRSIFVIASGSSLSFKGKGVAAQDAARQLGVRYVLEGSVRKAGGRVRIGVQLIDAADGAQIWTHRFEDTLEDVFALQDRVALAVAGKIEPTVRAGRDPPRLGPAHRQPEQLRPLPSRRYPCSALSSEPICWRRSIWRAAPSPSTLTSVPPSPLRRPATGSSSCMGGQMTWKIIVALASSWRIAR